VTEVSTDIFVHASCRRLERLGLCGRDRRAVVGLMFLRQVARGFVPSTLAAIRASAKLIRLLQAQDQE
jgi:hypothetical protein